MTREPAFRRGRSAALAAAGFTVLSIWVFAPTSVEQLAIATAVAVMAAFGVRAWIRSLRIDAHFHAAWVPPLVVRASSKLGADLARLAVSAVGAAGNGVRHRGGYHRVPCTAAAQTPTARARRAVILLAVSTPPNTIALDIECDAQLLVVHQAVPAPLPRDAEWPL